MKTCDFSKEHLIEYATGDILPETKKTVEGHLEECPACRSEIMELRGTLGIIRKWEVPESSVQWVFVPQKSPLTVRIREWLKKPAIIIPNWALGFAGAAVVLLVLAAAVNTRMQITGNGVALSTSLFGSSDTAGPEGSAQPVADVVNQPPSETPLSRQEAIDIVNVLFQARDERLRGEYQAVLTDLVKNMQVQRLEDMEKLSGLVALHQNSVDYRMQQRDELLKGLIRVSQVGQ